ncbi:hypothetical protein KJ359_001910 [Pestalotiopsis sp. 9143b]|nr:hypothetical protein KJ359_001910 [Pestalotiopsis sp. 9143b]
MSSNTPTYIPSPNWDIPADSKLVVLGRIIEDPKDPESQVPESAVLPIPPSAVQDGEKIDWETNLAKVRAGTIGLWAKCMQVLSGSMSYSQLKSSLENHKFSELETSYFRPDERLLAQALEDRGAQAYFQVHHWRKPVYLITGIKIARGASVSTENRVTRSLQAELKADATSTGVNIEVGPEASLVNEKKTGISYGGSTDYIFAYQLTRIKPKNKGKDHKSDKFVKGALYGKDEGDNPTDLKINDIFDIEEEISGGFQDTWEQAKDFNV